MPNTSLGPYKVTAKIGIGGMGEVYQARDTKLDRDAALKVLPEAFTSDPRPAAGCLKNFLDGGRTERTWAGVAQGRLPVVKAMQVVPGDR